MPKPAVHVPALVHHKPSNRARVRLGGRDVWLGPWGSPEAEERYRRVVAEWLTHGVTPVSRDGDAGPEIDELILAYWRHAKLYYQKDGRPTSQLAMLRGVLQLLRRHYGSTPVAAFDVLRLETLRRGLVESGLTRTGVNRRVDALRRVFKWGVTKKLVPIAVYQELTTLEGLKRVGLRPPRSAASQSRAHDGP
ncbi:MAG: hypothetical protein WBC44_03905 [Planctomycetaceae bacterium]